MIECIVLWVWVTANGTTHFTDVEENIPATYREAAEERTLCGGLEGYEKFTYLIQE
jgi:hypothetical protein